MSIKLSDSIRVGQQKPLEDKYFNELVPYISTSQVNTLIPKAVRHIGLTVNINREEYWYKDGIEDSDLIFKSNQKTIEVTKTELDVLISENKLEPNRLYKITGVESWCFSQHLIKAIYLKAITNNTLESKGVGEFYTPKYNTSDSNLGIWKGELLANGMISSASYNIGDKVIWGNLFWENISGEIGTNVKEYYDSGNDEYVYPKLQNYLSETDWKLITPNDDISLYNIQFDVIKYDLENDYVNYRADNLGNIYEISYITLLDFFPHAGIGNFIPGVIYNINLIALFQWGRGNTSNNIINESFVLNCNYNTSLFKSNTFVENSWIYDNNFLGVQIEGNNFKNSVLVGNYLKTYGGILYNNLENSSISSNKYYFEISYNNLKYNSNISNNNDNNITVGTKFSRIKGNNLDNSGKIENNIFVEEGKGISGNLKGIYDNNVKGISTISGNTIKNGSRIFENELNNYDEINGNNLDTDANIYINFLKSSCKINGNILTGHGRIYGNVLYRKAEVTNCKLRISPATSYASDIHTNKLFKGKIQNVDFGNIVNPEGTNPNDPAFVGNGLSECIVENSSVIKDLTFPNNGGILIQFVKMNGYSELKNITVNNSIINVDFINTIFNETSNYSKLIECSGYKTNGFTKTYIDNVLLQDRFDEKQDVLTEDNVGQFMDLELSTKSTPTSGDTVLGRDSVTGKAVEIPTDQLGGNVDLTTKLDKGTYTGTAQDLKNSIDNLQIGGRNLALNSKGFLDQNDDWVRNFNLSENLIVGQQYTVTVLVRAIQGINDYFEINDVNGYNSFPIVKKSDNVFSLTFVANHTSNELVLKRLHYGTSRWYQFESFKIEKGNKATDWTPAPEDKQDRLQDITGSIGIGKPDASATEKLDVNGNVKATGFKTPTGTANQALTANGGVFDLTTKADLVGGKVPSSQLPSYVDDVLEFANLASFPATGESGKIYIAIDTNITYRWGGSSYVVMSSSLALGETESTAYRGDRGKTAYDHSQATGNPHGTTKSDIGLGNVDNTSDLNKPISTATQTALNNKQDKLTNPITGTGTTNKISKFTANGVIGDSIIYENNNSISIGDDVSDARLRVKAQGDLSTDIVFRVRNSADTQDFLVVTGDGQVYNRGAQGSQYSTFFGENVGRNSTGGENNAFGYRALQANTTGYSNSAFGSTALYANIAGAQNSAFGSNALTSNISGNLNSAFGLAALYNNTTGYSNSAFGSGALGSNTTGAQNIAIGNSAGKSIIGGFQNSTPNNSVFIGFGTTANANNETNQIVIGHSAIGNGSNSVVLGNSSITRTRLQGQVIMGSFTTQPSGIEGAIYYNSTDKKHYGFNGTTWNALY